MEQTSFKSGVKGRGSVRWWERRWWLWWGDMCRTRWTRRRVNRIRLTEWKRELIPQVRLCISKRTVGGNIRFMWISVGFSGRKAISRFGVIENMDFQGFRRYVFGNFANQANVIITVLFSLLSPFHWAQNTWTCCCYRLAGKGRSVAPLWPWLTACLWISVGVFWKKAISREYT